MNKPLALDGVVNINAARDDEGMLREWRREKERLEQENRVLRAQLEEVKADRTKLERSIQALRNTLSPLHHALRAVFGEIELAVGSEDVTFSEEQPAQGASASRSVDTRWESYKQSFPGAAARIIDALLSHRELTITQLSVLLKMHYDTANGALRKLTKAGAVVREGKGYRLAQ